MLFEKLDIDGVLEFIPRRYGDDRGFFSETYSKQSFAMAGLDIDWVQDNHSRSEERGVLRGLHFQRAPRAQDKLIRVLRGSIFDVAVDLRIDSPTFGKWTSRILSAVEWNQLLIPKGFAHGFLTLVPGVEVAYKVSAPYSPEHDRTIRWDDPAIGITWPLQGCQPILSPKDRDAPLLADLAGHLSF
jgi:dTDP-4-dehydrorhamnose 3,5-epimerase